MESHELVQCVDARVWAQEFRKVYPEVPEDEAIGWFANAIMAGYDDHYYRSREYKRMVRRALIPWWKRPFVSLAKYGRPSRTATQYLQP